jgi:hypothetical protein
MRKVENMEKFRVCGYALIIITLSALLAFSNSVSSASVTSNVMISSFGSMLVMAKNFADIPADWRIGETWNAPTYLDYTVLHNRNPSIRMEKGPDASKSREILAADFTQSDWAIRVKPGDHIVFKIWMKTSASTIGDTTPTSGIRFGFDMYNSGGRITGIQSPDGAAPYGNPIQYPSNQYLNYVNWGSDWQQKIMEFIVPNQYSTDGILGYPIGQMQTPDRMIPWIHVWSDNYGNADNGIAWFADAQLYINP